MINTFKRLMKILMCCCHYGVDQEIFSIFAPSYLLKLIPYYRRLHNEPLGKRLHALFIDLGPLFIKLGQLISIRHDLFTRTITEPLSTLQDNVPPFDSDLAISTIEKAFGKPLSACFLTFDRKPLACASIAQVHRATLHNQSTVVVKVVRPNIQKTLKNDLKLLRRLCKVLSYIRAWNKTTILNLLDEYEYTLK